MLYRFREAQAAELGLGTRSDRRPRMASACKSLRECERWRGEILREISRKVSKIQDGLFSPRPRFKSYKLSSPCTAGLTDYEVRDLNDEINKLMREKRHWENQIIALGGANYRRNVAMLDDDGREVPGTKGYKCVVLPPANLLCLLIFVLSKVLWSSKRIAGGERAFREPQKRGG
jgi:pre-mRNA-splicing factor ISY1